MWIRTWKDRRRADVVETKITELEEELRVVANNLKSLEVAEEKANQREKTYKEQIKTLNAKLKQAEFAEQSVHKLQKEVEDELVAEQEKFKAVTEELEQTFAETVMDCYFYVFSCYNYMFEIFEKPLYHIEIVSNTLNIN